MFKGAWEQTVINWGTTSAVMEASMGWFYVSGVVFAALAALMLLHELWKLLTGQLGDADLIGVSESEDMAPASRPIPPPRREVTAMTIAIFLGALLGAMALGVPIAFSLLRLRRRADVAPEHVRRRRSWRRT